MQKVYTYDEAHIDHVADYLYSLLPECKVMTFTGSLGAGKTTLIRALLKKCGINETVTSPTFNYVNVYGDSENNKYFHFDLYRIPDMESFSVSGFDEYLYAPKSWSFIEWPEVIMPILLHDACHVNIEYIDDKRKATITLVR